MPKPLLKVVGRQEKKTAFKFHGKWHSISFTDFWLAFQVFLGAGREQPQTSFLLHDVLHWLDSRSQKPSSCLCVCVCVCESLSHVWLFATPRTVGHQASLSMEFSRQEYWSGLPFPSPEDLPSPGIEPWSPADSLPFELQGSPPAVWFLPYILIIT